VFFFRSTALFFSLFFVLLVFTFSGCARKDGRDISAKPTLPVGFSADKHNIKNGALPDRQNLLYGAAVKSGLHNDASIEGLVNDYRKNLYGNLFLEHYLSSRIKISMDKIREHYLNNRFSYVRQSNQVRLIQFLTQNEASAIKIKQALLRYDAELRASLLREHGVSPVTVSPGDLPQSLDLLLFGFSKPRGVFGPEKTSFGYHVLEVLEFFPEGSFRGLDEVYDEISQELYRSHRAVLYDHLLDSLATASSLSINKKGGA
jgi:hypothetical protein|tara:strand:- start:15405 stop:16184 length:780 start_codon:yes stop_codon:yes gene_type:complete